MTQDEKLKIVKFSVELTIKTDDPKVIETANSIYNFYYFYLGIRDRLTASIKSTKRDSSFL